jgi:hypothetical protein
MSERLTVRGKIARSATANPLDERIDPYQSIGSTLQSGTDVVLFPGASFYPQERRSICCARNATKKRSALIPFAGSQLD